jgi:hypothetical protein
MKLGFSQKNVEKLSHTKFQEMRPVGAELFHAGGQKDGHDEADSRFSQFCKRTYNQIQNTAEWHT